MFNKFKRNRLIFYNVIIFLNIITVGVYISSYSKLNTYWSHHKNITFSISNIKYLTTLSHLYLKEYKGENISEFEKVKTYLQLSLKDITILLEGGKINTFDFKNIYGDKYLNKELNIIKSNILKLIETLNDTSVFGIKSDKSLDKEFFKLIEEYELIQKYINKQSNELYAKTNTLQILLYLTVTITVITNILLLNLINKELKDKIKESLYDELTDIQNVKGFNQEIKKHLQLYERYQAPFSLIIFDIDDFKKVNDTYGHAIGDKVLVELAKLVTHKIRKDLDMVFRVGGEEFVIICSQTSLNEAIKIAQKVRLTIEQNLKIVKNHKITISLGVSEVESGDNKDEIYKRVDNLLYKSKNSGKNKVSY